MPELEAIKNLLDQTGAELRAWHAAKAALGRQYAPDFRLSQFFRSDEMGLSAMFAFLLDPQATHGQGDSYLVEFLKACDLSDIAITQHFLRVPITVKTEVQTIGQRRADIVVTSPTSTLLIENKPWAGDQKDQIADYARWLNHERPGKIVYLCQEQPSADSIALDARKDLERAGRYVRLDFMAVRQWLVRCLAVTIPPTVRTFLQSLIEYVDMTIIRETPDMLDPNIRTLINHNIEAAFAIAESVPDFKKKVLEDFLADLGKRLDTQGFVLAFPDKTLRRLTPTEYIAATQKPYARFTVYRQEHEREQTKAQYCLAFTFDRSGFNDLIWGISKHRDSSTLDPGFRDAILTRITERFGQGQDSDYWAWYQHGKAAGLIANDWGQDAAPWKGMQSSDTREQLLETFIKLIIGAHEIVNTVALEHAP